MKKNTHLIIGIGVTALGILGAFTPGLIEKTSAQHVSFFDVFPSNSRLSFMGLIAPGGYVDTSIAYIQTSMNATLSGYSTTSAQLINGDHILIGGKNFIVATTSAVLRENQIPLTTTLEAADIIVDTPVIAKMTGDIKLVFTPNELIDNGSFTFLFPAADGTSQSNDGMPDSGGYDFNNAEIICPTPAAGYTHWSASASASVDNDRQIGNFYYHAFTCEYSGTSDTSPLEFTISGLINPAPKIYPDVLQEDRTISALDMYGIFADQSNEAGAIVKYGNSYAGYGSAVKMTVKVLPQLTFEIDGIGEGENICDMGPTEASTVTTTGFLVPFGSISNAYFTNAAQKIRVTTNAAYGYAVTVTSRDQMGLNGDPCPGAGNTLECIPGYGSVDSNKPWLSITDGKGFGYTLHVVDADSDDYQNTPGTPNVTVAFNKDDGWRKFPDRSESEQPVHIINNLKSTNQDVIEVCYRIVSDASNLPGDYETTLTYTITATF